MSQANKNNDFRAQFDVLLRSAVSGISDLRNVVVSTAKVGKHKLNETMLRRERDQLMQELGEMALVAVETGAWSPEGDALNLVDRIANVTEQMVTHHDQVGELIAPSEIDAEDSH